VLDLRRLRWLTVLAPTVGLAAFEYLRRLLLGSEQAQPWLDSLSAALVVLVGSVLFSHLVFRRFEGQSRDVHCQAVVEERERLAREMHDGIAQTLAHLNVRIQALKELLGAGRLDSAYAQLSHMELLMDAAYGEVRRSIYGLRIGGCLGGNLASYLSEYVRRWGDEDGVQADFSLSGAERPELPPEVEVQLVRIVQEALANIRQHARATRASVSLQVRGDRLRLVVQDNGRGFEPPHFSEPVGQHFGLQTMRERAESVGGHLDVQSRPGQGTCVVADLPLK